VREKTKRIQKVLVSITALSGNKCGKSRSMNLYLVLKDGGNRHK